MNMLRTFILSCLIPLVLMGQDLPPDVIKSQYLTPSGNQVWVYLPAEVKTESLPCILIAAAGTRIFHGIGLADGDMPEHIPYVKAGFAVVAYGLSGPWPKEITEASVRKSIQDFIQSQGGVNDAVEALKLAKSKHAVIDTGRAFVAGHSSAGVLALNLAQKSSLFKGCIAYAAPADLEKRYGAKAMDEIETSVKGFKSFILGYSPRRHIEDIKCPVFIFHSTDDPEVPHDMIVDYVSAIKEKGKIVKSVEALSGGHYDPMIKEGIPQAIEWMQGLLPPVPDK
jgi:dipeptidyl aminopeptidase/acylaminoacyl peptidase